MATTKGKIPPQFLQHKQQVARRRASSSSNSGKKSSFPGADPATQNQVDGYTYADLPELRKEDQTLKDQQLRTTNPSKRQQLHQQQLRVDAIIKRLTTPKGN